MKISKEHIKKLNDLNTVLEDAVADLNRTIDSYNEAMSRYFSDVEVQTEKLNELIGEVDSLREEICSEIQDYIDSRSDKWQESEAGEEVAELLSEWENADFAEVLIDPPEEIDEVVLDFDLSELATET